jgi:TIR domain
MSAQLPDTFDVFLSHAHLDAAVVEVLGAKLQDRATLEVWLDRWVLVPGEHWQQKMARGLDQAKTCAVCIGQHTPTGWFQEEIQRALNRQVNDPSFRVIPVILPNGKSEVVNDFLELRTWVEFKNGIDDGYALHQLVSGVTGKPPGRYLCKEDEESPALIRLRAKLGIINTLRREQLIDHEVVREAQLRLLIDEITK